MHRLSVRVAVFIAFVPGLVLSPALPAQAQMSEAVQSAPRTGAAAALQFTAGGHALRFSADGVYAAAGSHALHVEFMGANKVQPQAEGASVWLGRTLSLGRVTYANLWDGIRLTYESAPGTIYTETYTLAPGADASRIRLLYNAPLRVKDDGTLIIALPMGAMRESAPIAWQDIEGERRAVPVSFRVRDHELGFTLGRHDAGYAVTIDPGLSWNTFVGGSGQDSGGAIAVDASGNAYVTGFSTDTWGTPVRAYTSGYDAYAAKIDASGNLTWNTFLGGSGDEAVSGIAVDGAGNVYVAGSSPATWGSPVRAYGAGYDVFVAKLSSAGALSWNTFLGGSGDELGEGGVALDGNGNAYVAGTSYATWGSPVRGYSALGDAFAAKLDTATGNLTWNTFLGSSNDDGGRGIAADSSGNVYVAGYSQATWGSPVRAYTTSSSDAFAAKLASNGALTWSTFLGGSGNDDANGGIEVDGSGNVYVAGGSAATWGSPVRAFGFADAYAAKLNSSGSLIWNTFLGSGSTATSGYGLAVDASGNVYVGGQTGGTWGSPIRSYSASTDFFAAKLDSSGNLDWNTYLGGSGSDYGGSLAVDPNRRVYVLGISYATWGSPVRAYASSEEASLVRLITSPTDFNGDATTDVSVFRPSTRGWYVQGQFSTVFGIAGDIPVPADYDGNGKADVAVFRPSTASWYVQGQSAATYGLTGDVPMPGDYNGDGSTELAVYRPSTSGWYIKGVLATVFGLPGDIPVPGDYNGDGITDIAVFRPSTRGWFVRGLSSTIFGIAGDIPVPGDYDGNGTTDIAVYRPSTSGWFVQGQGSWIYGLPGDIPVPGDYNHSGTADLGVFRPTTAGWFVKSQFATIYGLTGDYPLPVRDTNADGTPYQ